MKRIIVPIILFSVLVAVYCYRIDIYNFYYNNFVPIEKKVSKLTPNDYYREYNFSFVKNTSNFIPVKIQDILDIYYTIINSGMEKFTFYCKKEYASCQKDVNDIANNQDVLSTINNFVHPYNSFKSIKTEINSNGEINISISKIYDKKQIYLIDYEAEKIIQKVIKQNMTNREKIKTIHDYIINNTKYDKNRADNKITQYASDNAYGVLAENYGVCSGYSDSMMLFLEKFNIKSIKVSSENHVWNYVFLNNQWLHLDLTWDDPITNNNKDILDNTYFLISDQKLIDLGSEEHYYNKKLYN